MPLGRFCPSHGPPSQGRSERNRVLRHLPLSGIEILSLPRTRGSATATRGRQLKSTTTAATRGRQLKSTATAATRGRCLSRRTTRSTRRLPTRSSTRSSTASARADTNHVHESMNYEIDKMASDAKLHAQLDRKHEGLAKEVKGLQGELADYNIILDKVGTNTQPEEIQQQYQMLKQHNDNERKKVDAAFTERATWEQRTKDVDHQV
eukprot:1188620-Prorocentrum_minimum.AAC.2